MTRRRINRPTISVRGNTRGRGDRALFLVVIALVIFGCLMIFSGSAPVAAAQDLPPYFYFVKQIQFVIMGLVLFLITYNVDYHNYPKIIVPGLVVTAILLILVLFAPKINDAHRWLDLKFITFQVSDLAKLTIILYLGAWLSKPVSKRDDRESIINYFKYNLGPFLLILGFFCFLIIIEPNLSTTLLIGITSLAIYYISGTGVLYNVGTAGITGTLAISGLIAGIIAPYRFARIKTFVEFLLSGNLSEPYGRDYQLRQILIAVGTGKLTGVGFAQSKQKFSYLTETAFSDTIFAVFSEEFGFIGSIVLVSIFIWIMYRGFKIAQNAPDKLGALIASGITIWLGLQAFIHFAVNVGLIPLTGMPLPFISYGGSSLISCMAAVGILLNISRYSKAEEYQ